MWIDVNQLLLLTISDHAHLPCRTVWHCASYLRTRGRKWAVCSKCTCSLIWWMDWSHQLQVNVLPPHFLQELRLRKLFTSFSGIKLSFPGSLQACGGEAKCASPEVCSTLQGTARTLGVTLLKDTYLSPRKCLRAMTSLVKNWGLGIVW